MKVFHNITILFIIISQQTLIIIIIKLCEGKEQNGEPLGLKNLNQSYMNNKIITQCFFFHQITIAIEGNIVNQYVTQQLKLRPARPQQLNLKLLF
jgi:hypothetical protein